MTREEAIDIILNDVNTYTIREGIALNMAIKALEQEPCDKQRYVVKGINNDKIEFVDKYSVRAFNRYVEFIKNSCKYETQIEKKVLEQESVLDKVRAEIEETYINLTYEENHKVGGSWGLRKAMEIIDKYKAESGDI